ASLPHGARLGGRIQTRARRTWYLFHSRDEELGRLPRAIGIVEPELDEQKPAAFRHEVEIRRPLLPKPVDHRSLESFQADRLEFQDLRYMIRCRERVGIPQADQRPVRRALDQAQPGFKHHRARPFAADDRTRYVETVL